MANQTDARSSDQIRRDIEGARSEFHHTVDALEHRLSPGQLVDELWGRMRGSADEGTVQAVGNVVRRHPAPAVLIGLGLAWMAVEKTGGGEGTRRVREGAGRVGAAGMEKLKGGASSAVGAAKGKARDVAEKVKSRASGAAGTVKAGMADARERAHDLTEHAGERLRGDGPERRSARSTFEEQPLAAGALTFGLGLAAGLMAPATEREDRLMGPTADAVKDEARRTTKDVADSARSVAEDMAEAVKEESGERDLPGRLEHTARDTGEATNEEARERARQEDVDQEGIRRRVPRAGEELRGRGRQSDR